MKQRHKKWLPPHGMYYVLQQNSVMLTFNEQQEEEEEEEEERKEGQSHNVNDKTATRTGKIL